MKMTSHKVFLPAVLSAAVAATLPTGAFAQLEEVLVTAERREASVQDVPIAVSAYNEDMIDKLQIDDTLDLDQRRSQHVWWQQHRFGYRQYVLPASAG